MVSEGSLVGAFIEMYCLCHVSYKVMKSNNEKKYRNKGFVDWKVF